MVLMAGQRMEFVDRIVRRLERTFAARAGIDDTSVLTELTEEERNQLQPSLPERSKLQRAVMHMIAKMARLPLLVLEADSLRAAFAELDPHSYGYVPTFQMRRMLDEPRRPVSRSLSAFQKDLLVEIADEDGNGKVDYAEFVKILTEWRGVKFDRHELCSLRSVIVITRHGARFPLKPFPKSTSWPRQKLFWETYGGRLTPVGHRQHQELGSMLREHYVKQEDFLTPDQIDFPSRVYAYTSNSDRTVGSAQSLLVGLFPYCGMSFSIEGDESDTQRDACDTPTDRSHSIQLRVADMTKDYTPLLHGFKANRAYSQLKGKAMREAPLFAELSAQPEYVELVDKLWRMSEFKKLSPEMSLEDRLSHLQSVAQQIAIERAYGIRIFANEAGEYFERDDETRVRNVADAICRIRYCGLNDDMQREMARLAAGPLPLEITRQFVDVAEERSEREFALYSAHDNTIMALLAQLGFKDWPIPQFAAHIIFELHYDSSTKGHFVRFAYNPDPASKTPVAEYKWMRTPPKDNIVSWDDAMKDLTGQQISCVPLEAFVHNVMHERRSMRSVEEWKSYAGDGGNSEGE